MPLRAAAHRTTPVCDAEWLEYTNNGRQQRVAVESSAWYAWLKAPTHTTFYFMSTSGTFTARREERRARSYWYAYSKKAGKTRKVYLGLVEQLSLERLLQAAANLADQSTSIRLLLRTKFMLPASRLGLVLRPQLIEHLNNQRLPLILVCAPAGFGKTTLIADWARTQPHPLAWLSLDANDNQPNHFWSYLLTALHNVAPKVVAEALALHTQSIALSHVLTSVINGLTSLNQRLTLVLDDYQTISDPTIHRDLAWLIDHAPAEFQLVLLSRSEPPLPLARWRVAGHLHELLVDTLRFSKAEISTFLGLTMQLELPDETLANLETRTEGWIAGLQLLTLSIHGQNPLATIDLLATISVNQRAIFDYFTQEILQHQPLAVQQFLLQTAILDRLSEALCQAVIDPLVLAALPASTAGLLDNLERSNLFVQALDPKQHWYRYHQLFRESLLQSAEQHLGKHGMAQLHGRASVWFEQAELFTEAINHALAASDFVRAGALIASIGFRLLLSDQSALVQAWLQALPTAVIEQNVQLCLWSAWILVSQNQLAATNHYLSLITKLLADMNAEDEQTASVNGHLRALQANIARRQGDMAQALALTNQALSSLANDNALLRSVITRNLCAGYLVSGDTVAAEQALQQALREQELLELRVSAGDVHPSERQYARTVRLLLWIETTSLRWLQGQLHAAADLYRQTFHLSREQHQHSVSAIACVNLGQILRQWNNLAEAREFIQQGNSYSQQIGADVTHRNGLIELARIQQACGEREQARTTMAQAVELAQSTRGLLWATTWQARLQLAQGDLAAAIRWAQAYQRQANAFPQFNLYDVEDLTLARVLIAQGQVSQACALLDLLLPACQTAGRLPSVIEVYLLQALALAANNDWAAASNQLLQALRLAEPEGYIRLFVDEGTLLADLLVRIEPQVQGTLRQYIQRLLVACGLSITSEPYIFGANLGSFIEPLSERELEVIRLLAAGFSNQAIAYQLVVTLNTIKTHLKNIYGKLAVSSRTQAIARARSLNLISHDN
ncbi:MAG: LuxR C-terminal-related transcriptional regulator [Chloroflexi bacterium]|nr:LuxR C-terminal-related transcriptional regulator [Chloroflexota bacterium]